MLPIHKNRIKELHLPYDILVLAVPGVTNVGRLLVLVLQVEHRHVSVLGLNFKRTCWLTRPEIYPDKCECIHKDTLTQKTD